jgi:hypothetical protein
MSPVTEIVLVRVLPVKFGEIRQDSHGIAVSCFHDWRGSKLSAFDSSRNGCADTLVSAKVGGSGQT